MQALLIITSLSALDSLTNPKRILLHRNLSLSVIMSEQRVGSLRKLLRNSLRNHVEHCEDNNTKCTLLVFYNNYEKGGTPFVVKPGASILARHLSSPPAGIRIDCGITSESSLYTLLLFDIDWPSPDENSTNVYLHWAVHNLKSNITVRQNKLKDESSVEYRGVAAPYKSGKHKYVYLLFNQKQLILKNETIHSCTSTFEDQNVANLLESVSSLGFRSIVGGTYFTSMWDNKCVDIVHKQMRWLPPTANLSPHQQCQSSWYYYDVYNYQPDLKRTLISDRDRIAMVSVLLVSSSLAMGFFGKSTSDTGTAAVCFQILLFAFAFLALISAVVEALLLNKQSQSLTYANYMTLTKCDCFPSWLFLVLTLLVLPCAFGLRFIADTYHDDDDDDNDDPSKHRRKFEVAFVIVAMSLTSLIMILKLWLLSIGNTVS